MEGAPPPAHQGPPPMRGGFRGRGGMPMRGFDRGRGRGMGRGGPMVMRGGMGPPPMMRGRGGMMRGPVRGMGFPRGGPPRGGGPPMRGRPPVHSQPYGYVTAVSQPPPPADSGAGTNAGNDSDASTAGSSATTATTTTTTVASTQPSTTPSGRGLPRGRGGPLGRGRGSYIPSTNGSAHDSHSMYMPKPYRGAPTPRGRGGYSQGMPRPPPAHSANTQVAPVPTLKRGAPTGPPGPKRGRYDQGPSNRQLVPKHAPQVQAVHAPAHSSYNAASTIPSHHSGYQGHDQMQHVDQYSHQSYTAPPPQTSYNGYSSTGYGTTASTGYSQSTEYDHTQYSAYNNYNSYSSTGYGQQDTRYQGYSQDYSQTYGAPAVDYTAPPPDYTQQTTYDDRTYSGYDAQTYAQGYASGYY